MSAIAKPWAIQAQVEWEDSVSGRSGSLSIPTFYLDPSVQGILTANQAKRIAEDIITAFRGSVNDPEVKTTLHISAEQV